MKNKTKIALGVVAAITLSGLTINLGNKTGEQMYATMYGKPKIKIPVVGEQKTLANYYPQVLIDSLGTEENILKWAIEKDSLDRAYWNNKK